VQYNTKNIFNPIHSVDKYVILLDRRFYSPTNEVPRSGNLDNMDMMGSSGKTQITSYTETKISVNGKDFEGAITILPHTVLPWNVKKFEDITLESFALATIMNPKREIILVGTGAKSRLLDESIITALESKGIAVEVMTTHQAFGTYNFMNQEDRHVACFLLPYLA